MTSPESDTHNGFTAFPAIIEDDSQDQNENAGFLGGFIGRLFRTNTEPKQIGVEVQSAVEVQTVSVEEQTSPNGSVHFETSRSQDISPRPPLDDEARSIDSLSLANTNTADKKFGKVTSFFRRNRNQQLIDYDRSDHRRYWMPDSTGKECYECHEKFTTFRRRHHCRLCGQIFCSKCSNMHINGARLGYTGMLRVCGYCASNVDKFLATTSNQSIEEKSERSQSPTNDDTLATSTDTLSSAGIATVSNGTIWSSSNHVDSYERNDSFRHNQSESDNNLVGSSSRSTNPPSMLCVQKLALQEYERFLIDGNKTLSSSFELAEDDNEPEWVKKISADMQSMRDFTSVECAAYEIQPCTSVTEEVDSPASQESPKKVSPKSYATDDEVSKDVDVYQLFEKKLSSLLDFLFEREQIDAAQWNDVIWNLSKEIVKTIKIDVRRGDAMNITKYVHIKKLLVDDPLPNYKIVHGVICTKSLAHTDMPSVLDNVSVMTLAGSIEYERVLEKLSSLEPIIIQESEYLKNQVNRITARRISLLLVENSVAKLAGDMLLDAQVALAINVKRTVLERVSRSTNADIITSVDAQFIQPQIGFCPKFKQLVVPLKNGEKKVIMIFDDCNGELGLSVLLRASSMRELKAAKKILNFMIMMRYSSNLEIDFLNMLNTYALPRSLKCTICMMNQECNTTEDVPEDGFICALERSHLTNSPFIHFAPPYLETTKGRKCYLRTYFKKPLFHFYTNEDFQNFKQKENELHENLEKLDSELKDLKLKIAQQEHRIMKEKKVTIAERDRVISFRARSSLLFRARYEKKKQIEAEIKERAENSGHDQMSITQRRNGANIDVLNPYNHQRIVFLYSAFSRKSANSSCLGPWLIARNFYGPQDIPLGNFLINYCFTEEYKCNACEKSMIEHQRKIVHKHARIEITTQIYVKSGNTETEGEGLPPSFSTNDSDTILAWRRCPTCKANSSVVQMKSGAWHMSFAKFVDYLANGIYCNSQLLTNLPQECDQCTFHEHHHYFSCNKFITCFKVIPIRPLHVVFSPILCKIEPLTIYCQAVILKKQDLILEAEGVFQQAESLLENHEGHMIEHLRYALKMCRENFECLLNKINMEKKLENSQTMLSNDESYLKAIDIITGSRYLTYAFINEWNTIRSTSDTAKFSKKSSTLTLPNGDSKTDMHISGSNVNLQGSDPTADMLLIVESVSRNSSPSSSTSNLAIKEQKDAQLPPLNNPFSKALHLEMPLNEDGVPVVVKDMIDFKGNTHPDIGSIIAYALSCKEYKEKKKFLQDTISDEDRPLTLRSSLMNGNATNDARSHIELDFSDSRAQYFVKVYFADRFDLLRKVIFVDGEDHFIRSLASSSSWHPQGGKSGASFFRTQDERFVFKQMSRIEVECFKKCAHNYFDYIYTAVTEKKLTALCKIYGVFRVGYTSKQSSQQLKMDVLVMEYLFYRKNVKQLWDLKGSLRNRYASTKSATPVLLDENLVQDLWGNQIYVHPYSKASLNQSISNDSHFLSSQDIMDYSLLAGICEENNEVIIGIVDYMRTYTLDKKVESLLKTALPSTHLPTVVSPEVYCKRFCEAIDLYFPIAPDQWTGLDSSMHGIL